MPLYTTPYANSSGCTSTPYGKISYKGEANSLKMEHIFLENEEDNILEAKKTNAEIKFYKLADLKKLPSFKDIQTTSTVHYVNEWFIKRDQNTMLVYATKNQVAFEFTSDGNVEENLQRFCQAIYLSSRVEFCVEERFTEFLANTVKRPMNLFRQLLKKPSDIEMYLKYQTGFAKLLTLNIPLDLLLLPEYFLKLVTHEEAIRDICQAGATYEDLLDEQRLNFYIENFKQITTITETIEFKKLCKLPPNQLQHLLKNADNIKSILKFITVNQLLGVDHVPLALSANAGKWHLTRGNLMPKGIKIYMDHGEWVSADSITIKLNKYSENPNQLNMHTIPFPEELYAACKDPDAAGNKATLVHDWYEFKTDKPEQRVVCCPDLRYALVHCAESPVNVEEIESVNLNVLAENNTYYREKAFLLLLKKSGFTLETFLALPEMNFQKAVFLSQHVFVVKELLANDLSWHDIAKINEERGVYIATHFEEAKAALAFVDAKELCGLHYAPVEEKKSVNTSSVSRSGMFATNMQEESKQEQTKPKSSPNYQNIDQSGYTRCNIM